MHELLLNEKTGRQVPVCREKLSSRSDRAVDPLFEFLLGRCADLTRSELAALEHHQSWDRHHAVFGGRVWVLVHVELHNLDLAGHGAGDLFERWADHAAWAAPLSPEIDDDR